MRVLIIGASGLIGKYLLKEFSKDSQVIGTSRSSKQFQKLDISNKTEVVNMLTKIKPDTVIVSAAMPFVDYCEMHEAETDKINFLGITYICNALHDFLPLSRIVFLSSDYVFNGTKGKYKELDKRNPLNVYGKQKMRAEEYIRESSVPFLIIRTNWVYGAEEAKKNFVCTVMGKLKSNNEMDVASDQIANPTYAGDIAKGIHWLVVNNKNGIFHIAGKDYVSRYDFAKKIAQKFQLPVSLLRKVKTEEMKQVAKRPLNSGLSTKLFTKISHIHCLGIAEGLDNFEKDQDYFSR